MILDTLQNTHVFHVERIIDYLNAKLPLCAIHQSRSILFFCYVFALIIEFLLYPPYSSGNSPFSLSTMFVPLLLVVFLHIILSLFYLSGALFERASWKTAFALLYFLHAPVPLVNFISAIVMFNQEDPNYLFGFSVSCTVSFFIDFLCGIVSRPKQVVPLSFEFALMLSFSLEALYAKKMITSHWISLIPMYLYYIFYFSSLLILTKFCSCCNSQLIKLFSNPEITAEFKAAVNNSSYKNRVDWIVDDNEQRDEHVGKQNIRGYRTQETERIVRFPSRAKFQLYNVDGTPEYPLYLSSPFPVFVTLIITVLFTLQTITPFANFLVWLCLLFVLLIVSILLNSRTTACSFISFTNLDEICVDTLWDHPSLNII